MTEKEPVMLDGADVSGCDAYSAYREGYCGWYVPCSGESCSYKIEWLANELAKANKKLADIEEIIAPYNIPAKKICGNCTRYMFGGGMCTRDLPRTTYTTQQTKACEAFCYTDELVPNVLANRIKDVIDRKG